MHAGGQSSSWPRAAIPGEDQGSSSKDALSRHWRKTSTTPLVVRLSQRGSSGCVVRLRACPRVVERVERLSSDPDFAWRWFACILLAEELEDT